MVHIHAIAYGIPADRKTIKAFREWVAVAWSECVRADHQERRREVGTTVEVPKQGRAVTRYISKYMSKPEPPAILRIGRWWDTWNDAALPTLTPSRIPVTDDEARTIKVLMDERVKVSYMARRMRQGATDQEAEEGWLTIPRPAHTRRVLTDQPPEWTEVLTICVPGQPHMNLLTGSGLQPGKSSTVTRSGSTGSAAALRAATASGSRTRQCRSCRGAAEHRQAGQ